MCRILTTVFSRALPLLALQLVGLGTQEETFDEIRLVVYHVTLRLDAVFPEVQVNQYLFPAIAGVAFSRNPFRWNRKIRREDGFLRIVWGLGTRAVERVANVLSELLPDDASYADYVKVIDVSTASGGRFLEIVMDGEQEQALAYLTKTSKVA